SSPNKRLVTVKFDNLGPEDDNKEVFVKISNIDDVRLTKDESLVLVYVAGEILYRLSYIVVSDVDGVNPQSNQQLMNLLFTIFDATP
ncbi:MAG: hypothetical protein ACYS17_16515, partial [Planctomycetota bacterium]